MKRSLYIARRVAALSVTLFVMVTLLSASVHGTGVSAAVTGSAVQMRGIIKTHMLTLDASTEQTVRGVNLYQENCVTVQFVQSYGPTEISAYIIDSAGNVIGPKNIHLGDAADFMLQSTSGAYDLHVAVAAGHDEGFRWGWCSQTIEQSWLCNIHHKRMRDFGASAVCRIKQ